MKIIALLAILLAPALYGNTTFLIDSSVGQARGNFEASGDSHSFSGEADYWIEFNQWSLGLGVYVGETMATLDPGKQGFKTLLRIKNLSYGPGLKVKSRLNAQWKFILGAHTLFAHGSFELNQSTPSSTLRGNYSAPISGLHTSLGLAYEFMPRLSFLAGLKWNREISQAPDLIAYDVSESAGSGLSLSSGLNLRERYPLPSDLTLDTFAIQLGLIFAL